MLFYSLQFTHTQTVKYVILIIMYPVAIYLFTSLLESCPKLVVHLRLVILVCPVPFRYKHIAT